MLLQRRLFGTWSLFNAQLSETPERPYQCRWEVQVLWTPHRWAQWVSWLAVRSAVAPCWIEGDHIGTIVWVYDGNAVSAGLATALRDALLHLSLQRNPPVPLRYSMVAP